MAASDDERTASQLAARERHSELNKARPKAQDGSGATVMLVYDEIGFWGITAADLVADLQGISGDLELHLNTPGGDVFDGIAIANALKQRAGQVRVVVDGLAASIGSVIAMAASPGQMVMMPNATLMIHDAWGLCIGSADDMAGMQALLDQQSGNIASIYAARSGTPADGWRTVMKAESWMIGQEAVTAGLADSLGGSEPPASAAVAERIQALPQVVIVNTPGRRPRLGLESMPLLNKAIPVHHTATVDTPWDGPAAVAAMPAEYADLHYCHAWQTADADSSSHTPGDDDADDKKGNFKFPHHAKQGGPANLAACRNGLARLSGASIPDGDRPDVEAHLQAHMKDGGSDAGDHAGTDQFLHDLMEGEL
jgi:ATP-dependent protease ClpP protease subunit